MARIAFVAAVSLISAGASLAEHSEGRILTVAGYGVFAVILIVMIYILLLLWQRLSMLMPFSKKVDPNFRAAKAMMNL